MKIIAHRGASHDAPENTLAAMRLAVEQGADGVECDVHLSSDDEVVVMHDGSLERTTDREGQVRSTPWSTIAQLDAGGWKGTAWEGERVPLLQQVLDGLPLGKSVYVEAKEKPEIVPPMLPLLEAAMEAGREVVAMSLHLETVAEMKQRLPACPCLWVVNLGRLSWYGAEETAQGLVSRVGDLGLDGLALSGGELLTRRLVEVVQAADLHLAVWTVDEPKEAAKLAWWEIDALITNRPGLMRRELG